MEGPAPSLTGALLAAYIDRPRNLIQQDRHIKEFHPNQFAECDRGRADSCEISLQNLSRHALPVRYSRAWQMLSGLSARLLIAQYHLTPPRLNR